MSGEMSGLSALSKVSTGWTTFIINVDVLELCADARELDGDLTLGTGVGGGDQGNGSILSSDLSSFDLSSSSSFFVR